MIMVVMVVMTRVLGVSTNMSVECLHKLRKYLVGN
jgi:hypothetical protein